MTLRGLVSREREQQISELIFSNSIHVIITTTKFLLWLKKYICKYEIVCVLQLQKEICILLKLMHY